MQRFALRVGVVVACATLAACSFQQGALGDAGSTGGELRPPDSSLGAWSDPIELTALTSNDEDDPSLTNDLLEIYFGSRRVVSNSEDIYVSKRATTLDPWAAPVPVVELNSMFAETTMKVTGDGLSIFFASNRGGGLPDIYFSTRPDRDTPWVAPMRIDQLSTGGGDYGAFAQQNLRRVVLCAGPSVVEEAMYISERASTVALWGPLTRIMELDDVGVSECDPMEPHPRALYFASDRLTGKYDIYRAQHNSAADPYGFRTPLDLPINLVNFNDRDPWVSADERTLVFSSNRSGVLFRIYMSTR